MPLDAADISAARKHVVHPMSEQTGQSQTAMFPTLRELPLAVRLLFSCFLATIGIGYGAAMLLMYLQNVDPHRAMNMNLVQGVVMKYHGQRDNTRLESAIDGAMADKLDAPARDRLRAWIRGGAPAATFASDIQPILEGNCAVCHNPKSGLPVPSLASYEDVLEVAQPDLGESVGALARVSHIHLFGISLLFMLTGAIFALSEVRAWLRNLLLVTPFAAIWLDIGSWWFTKYAPLFGYVVVVGGALMGAALAGQIGIALWQMWWPRSEAS